MLNIISNDCTGSYLYKNLIGCEYPNMFASSWISAPDFNKLIANFDRIDFKKIDVKKISELKESKDFDSILAYSRFNNDLCYITIDNTVKMVYDRYVEDTDLKYPENNLINGSEYICVPDLKLYAKERYYARLVRMLNNSDPTIFVFNQTVYSSYKDVKDFVEVETPYIKILYTTYPEMKLYENDNLIVEVVDTIDYDSYIDCAEFIYDKI